MEDIRLLIGKLTHAEAGRTHREEPVYTDAALERLEDYHWPGNVRELKNFVKRILIQWPGKTINSIDIDKLVDLTRDPDEVRHGKVVSMEEAERRHIINALIRTKGRVGGRSGAAILLGLPRSTFQYRLKKLGINPNHYV